MDALLDETSKCGESKDPVRFKVCMSGAIAVIVLIAGYVTDHVPSASAFFSMFVASVGMLGFLMVPYLLILITRGRRFKEVSGHKIDFFTTALYLGCSATISLLPSLFYDLIGTYSQYVMIPCVFMYMLGLLSVVILMMKSMRLFSGSRLLDCLSQDL